MQVIDCHFSLEPVQVISSICIKLKKISNPNIIQVVSRIRANVSPIYVRCQRQEKQIYSESLFRINLQCILCLYLIICDEPREFIRAGVSN